eukprot:1945300-Karenia_brevis.AAC.1
MVDRKYSLRSGVRIGVTERLPRTPSLYERKTRFRKYDEDIDGSEPVSKDNYASVKENKEAVRQIFVEEAKLGIMREEPLEVAQREYGDDL